MFGLSDLPKFFLAFFLVLPVISIIHESGHVFFAWLMGAKDIRIVVGHGKPILKFGMIDIRKYYFWYGSCTFENIKRKKKSAYILIFAGGIIFNLASTIAVILLVENKTIDSGILSYQFTYFSMYYIFFALLPMIYPGGYFSDGKIILSLLRNKNNIIKERTYRIDWKTSTNEWEVRDHQNEPIQTFKQEGEALEKAKEIAQNNRPSRILRKKDNEEKEIQNYPRPPL